MKCPKYDYNQPLLVQSYTSLNLAIYLNIKCAFHSFISREATDTIFQSPVTVWGQEKKHLVGQIQKANFQGSEYRKIQT